MKNKKGFTLIELLAVILIFAIIALIAIPAVSKIIKEARDKAFIIEAQNYINAAENALVIHQYKTPKNSTDDSLIFLISDLDISNDFKSPYGKKYLDGSNVTVTADNNGNLIYSVTAFDEDNNAIVKQTFDDLEKLGTSVVKKTTPEEENIVLPRKFAIGDIVNLKNESGSFTVIKAADASATRVVLFSNSVLKKDQTGLDNSCVGAAPYCSVVKFDADPYNAKLDLNALTSDNIGYYVAGYQTKLRTKYSDNSILVDLPTIDTLLSLTGEVSLDAIRDKLGKSGNTRDLNLESLNLKNIDIMFKGQNYWFNSTWLDTDSGKNWYWYARDSYGKVIDAYWSNHDSMAGVRPVITIPVQYVE